MVDFPYNACWQSVQFNIVGNSVSGGFGLSGASINVASNSGHWVAEASFSIYTEEQYLLWQGFIAEMRGVLGTTLVPAMPRWLPFDAQARRLDSQDATDLGDGPIWDGTGLGMPLTVHAYLNAGASLRDGEIRVHYTDTLGLRPGHLITLGDNLHQVVSAHNYGPNIYKVQIEPILRQNFPQYEPVVIDRPHCRMRFADSSQGIIGNSVRSLDNPTVRFVEDVQ